MRNVDLHTGSFSRIPAQTVEDEDEDDYLPGEERVAHSKRTESSIRPAGEEKERNSAR
jgi:hypothetical protein